MRGVSGSATRSTVRLRAGGDEFELDAARHELRRGGAAVDLELRPLRLFEYLVENGDRFVSRDELIDRVWEGVVVSDAALSSAVKLLRRALDDDAREPRWIESRRGRGYRFVGEVLAELATTESDAGSIAKIGRERLVERLLGRVSNAANGKGRAILLSGGPRIGKTSLAERLLQEATAQGLQVIRSAESRGPDAPALWTWRPIARALAIGAPESTADGSGATLKALAAGSPMVLDQPLFPVFEAIERGIREAGRARSIVLAFEDLDAADAPSLRLLDHLLASLRSLPCLVIGTFRAEAVGHADPLAPTLGEISRHDWCERVRLLGLSADGAARLAEHLTGDGLPPERARALVERTAGNPFYLRELIIRDASVERALPESISDEIRARLAALGAGRADGLGAAAVLGDVVDAEVVSFVCKQSVEGIDDALSAAHRAGIGRFESDGRFRFESPIVREAIYEGIDPRVRVEIHRRMGEAFEEESEAPASIEWMRGDSGAFGDLRDASLGHLRRGFEALGELSPGSTRDQLELDLQISLARALARVQGWAGDTVEVWQRASELCARSGDSRREGVVRVGIAAGMLTLGRMDETLARYSDVLKLGHETDDRALQVAGCIRAVPLMYMGRLSEAATTLRAGLALLHDDDDFFAMGFSEDFRVTLRQWFGWVHWLLGQRDQASLSAAEAVSIARTSDVSQLTYALVWSSAVDLVRDDYDGAMRQATEAHEIARRERFPLVESLSTMAIEAARGLSGGAVEAGEAATRFTRALESMGTSGNRSGAGLMLSFLARLQMAAKDGTAADSTIGLALALSPETGAFFDAELLRLRGEVAFARGDHEQAERDYRSAIGLAREQSAGSFEMRAATALAGLLHEQGRGSEAIEILRGPLAAITEGRNLPDACAAAAIDSKLAGDLTRG